MFMLLFCYYVRMFTQKTWWHNVLLISLGPVHTGDKRLKRHIMWTLTYWSIRKGSVCFLLSLCSSCCVAFMLLCQDVYTAHITTECPCYVFRYVAIWNVWRAQKDSALFPPPPPFAALFNLKRIFTDSELPYFRINSSFYYLQNPASTVLFGVPQ